MPWPQQQSIAILVKARRSGDTRLEAKARNSLRGKSAGRRRMMDTVTGRKQ